jgi:hypothetical protein
LDDFSAWGISFDRKAPDNGLIVVRKFLSGFPGQEMKGYDNLEMLVRFHPSCDVRRE